MSNGTSLDKLALIDDDVEADNLGDGIFADRLISGPFSIPGFINGPGYNTICQRIIRELKGRIIEGSIHQPNPAANFYTFPYDWRRDLRATARQLQRFVEPQLDSWRRSSGADNAEIIYLAHSMGGLVARYYLEHLGGWRTCRALITFGSPHRGSLNALDFLSNGFRISGGTAKRMLLEAADIAYPELFEQLAATVRTFPSVYQLLCTYEAVQIDDEYRRIVDMSHLPNIDMGRAQEARQLFHEIIKRSVEENLRLDAKENYSLKTIPVVGIAQDTFQSAYLSGGRVELSYLPPPKVGSLDADGDGTVPLVSAIPVELENKHREYFVAQQHGFLTSESSMLTALLARIRRLAADSSPHLFGDQQLRPPIPAKLSVEPLQLASEPIRVDIAIGSSSNTSFSGILHVEAVDGLAEPVAHALAINSHQMAVELQPLPPGLYRVHMTGDFDLGHPVEVTSLFEVVE